MGICDSSYNNTKDGNAKHVMLNAMTDVDSLVSCKISNSRSEFFPRFDENKKQNWPRFHTNILKIKAN